MHLHIYVCQISYHGPCHQINQQTKQSEINFRKAGTPTYIKLDCGDTFLPFAKECFKLPKSKGKVVPIPMPGIPPSPLPAPGAEIQIGIGHMYRYYSNKDNYTAGNPSAFLKPILSHMLQSFQIPRRKLSVTYKHVSSLPDKSWSIIILNYKILKKSLLANM